MTAKFEEEFHGKPEESSDAKCRLFHLKNRFGIIDKDINWKKPPDFVEIQCMGQHEIWKKIQAAGMDSVYVLVERKNYA